MRKTLFGNLGHNKVYVPSSSGCPYNYVLQTDSSGKQLLVREKEYEQPDWLSCRISSQIKAGIQLVDRSDFRVGQSLEASSSLLSSALSQVNDVIESSASLVTPPVTPPVEPVASSNSMSNPSQSIN